MSTQFYGKFATRQKQNAALPLTENAGRRNVGFSWSAAVAQKVNDKVTSVYLLSSFAEMFFVFLPA